MEIWLWIGFVVFVLIMLALDLGVFNREAHVISAKEALRWTSVCVVLALLFSVLVYFIYQNGWFGVQAQGAPQQPPPPREKWGWTVAVQYLTGYIIEMSLSLDNIFVIAMIFSYFAIPRIYQHRVLFWGIMGALIMRGIMIIAGAALIKQFHWIIYVFGGLLIVTAIKMMRSDNEEIHPDSNPLVKLARRVYPVTSEFHGEKFFVRIDGKRAITPLFLALLVVESTDVLFAVDSVPAIFAITTDPFIVFTSNVFAILCLRSMFFALAAMLDKFRYLKTSLVFILLYVGAKMLLTDVFHIPAPVSLAVIVVGLGAGVVASIYGKPEEVPLPKPPGADKI